MQYETWENFVLYEFYYKYDHLYVIFSFNFYVQFTIYTRFINYLILLLICNFYSCDIMYMFIEAVV